MKKAGCPTLAAFLFLRLGWETITLNQPVYQEANSVARYAEPLARLIEELKKLPGVGAKSAQRFAFHILRSTDEDAAALAEAVHGLKASLRLCSVCNNVTDVDPCAYCSSASRNQRLVCVVEI